MYMSLESDRKAYYEEILHTVDASHICSVTPLIDGDLVVAGQKSGHPPSCALSRAIHQVEALQIPLRLICRATCTCRGRVQTFPVVKQRLFATRISDGVSTWIPKKQDLPASVSNLLQFLPTKKMEIGVLIERMKEHDAFDDVRMGYAIRDGSGRLRDLWTHSYATASRLGLPDSTWLGEVIRRATSMEDVHAMVVAYPYQSARALSTFLKYLSDIRDSCSHIVTDEELLRYIQCRSA